jgi:hypothetical protein
MPKQYEKIRDSLKKGTANRPGLPDKEAKRIAAATYNKHRGNKPPVTGKHKKGTRHG